MGNTTTIYDSRFLPIRAEESIDTNQTRSVAVRTYDDVGNVLTETKPVQYVNAGPASTNIYDATYQLYPVQQVNELGHLTSAVLPARGAEPSPRSTVLVAS